MAAVPPGCVDVARCRATCLRPRFSDFEAHLPSAVREADIVATCTDSTQTVFDEPEWLKEGAHITCVRACEVGPKVVKRCDLSVKLGRNTIETMDEGMIRLHGNVGYIAGQPEERQGHVPLDLHPAVNVVENDVVE